MTTEINKSEEDLQIEVLKWKSSLQFIHGEIVFILQLLNAHLYKSETPNLFERIQEFKQEILKMEGSENDLMELILKHEKELEGIIECDTISCDDMYYKKHKALENAFDVFYKNFQELKSKVFYFLGGVLKK